MPHGIPTWLPPTWRDPDQKPIRNHIHHLPLLFDVGEATSADGGSRTTGELNGSRGNGRAHSIGSEGNGMTGEVSRSQGHGSSHPIGDNQVAVADSESSKHGDQSGSIPP
jgi:hypothetical protein